MGLRSTKETPQLRDPKSNLELSFKSTFMVVKNEIPLEKDLRLQRLNEECMLFTIRSLPFAFSQIELRNKCERKILLSKCMHVKTNFKLKFQTNFKLISN